MDNIYIAFALVIIIILLITYRLYKLERSHNGLLSMVELGYQRTLNTISEIAPNTTEFVGSWHEHHRKLNFSEEIRKLH